jgi:hypothetical protein
LRIERAGKGRLKCTGSGELSKQHMAWHGVWERTVVRERPVTFGWLHDLRSAGVRSVERVAGGGSGFGPSAGSAPGTGKIQGKYGKYRKGEKKERAVRMRQYSRAAQRGRLAERLRGSETRGPEDQRLSEYTANGKWQIANAQRNMQMFWLSPQPQHVVLLFCGDEIEHRG